MHNNESIKKGYRYGTGRTGGHKTTIKQVFKTRKLQPKKFETELLHRDFQFQLFCAQPKSGAAGRNFPKTQQHGGEPAQCQSQ
mgnify:CR=1 FL=1